MYDRFSPLISLYKTNWTMRTETRFRFKNPQGSDWIEWDTKSTGKRMWECKKSFPVWSHLSGAKLLLYNRDTGSKRFTRATAADHLGIMLSGRTLPLYRHGNYCESISNKKPTVSNLYMKCYITSKRYVQYVFAKKQFFFTPYLLFVIFYHNNNNRITPYDIVTTIQGDRAYVQNRLRFESILFARFRS